MRSADDEPTVLPAPDRIRDGAIELFAERGVAATSVRAIADRAGVSAGLVLHHFGSKDALRVACDDHVAALVRDRERAAMPSARLDPLAGIRSWGDGPPVVRYLARTLVDGSPAVGRLVDELVADATAYMEEAVAVGALRPSEDPRGRAAVLTLWSLGALVLHEHAHRLLGVDLTADPAGVGAYAVPAAEMLSRGVLDEDTYRAVRDGYADLTRPEGGRP